MTAAAGGAPKSPQEDRKDGGLGDGYRHQEDPEKSEQGRGEKDPELRWGVLCFSPSWMQWANRPQVVIICICWFTLLQGFVVNGVNNVNTSTLERRFKLASWRVSLVSSAYDVSAGLCVLPLTYLLARAHYPRVLAVGSLCMSLGSLTMSIPHFASPSYKLVGSIADKCDLVGNGTAALCAERDSGLSNYLYVFILGQFLHGLGGATIYSLGIVYIDNNVHTEASPLYNGFNSACSALGPAIGYIIGGQMLKTFVDFDQRDISNLGITPEDPRWVGAWWVCFFVACFLFLTVFIMFIPYPRETPNAREVRRQRVSMAHADGSEDITSREGFGSRVRDLPLALWLLMKNPVNMLVTGGAVTEGLLTSGFATFMPKFLQNQYNLTAGTAAMLGGLMAVPGAAGGQLVGGLLARLLKLKVRGLLRMCLLLSLTCSLFGFSLLMNCGREKVAGVSVAYGNRSVEIENLAITNGCNADCNCQLHSYEPICGIDNVQYFSPCHAGCRNSHVNNAGKKVYTDCSCIPTMNTSTVAASEGKCTSDCNLVGAFLPFFFLIIFLTFCGSVPGLMASLRCIPDNQKILGLGFKWIFIRFLGTVPGPLFFGLLYDSTCILWQEKCEERGSCWIYDNEKLSLVLFIFCFVVKLGSSFFFLLASLVYKPPPEPQEHHKDIAMVNEAFQKDTDGATSKRLTKGGATEPDSTPDCVVAKTFVGTRL